MPLVIAGPRGWLGKQELQWLAGKHRRTWGQREVIRLPYVSQRELDRLIRGATGVAFVSLYEGFGLPIVEAFVRGTAVMTSDRGAMAEIAGATVNHSKSKPAGRLDSMQEPIVGADPAAAAILVDPYEIDSIAAGLRRLVHDAAGRAEFIKRGRTRAEHFSAEACGGRLQAAYRQVGITTATQTQ